MTLTTHPSKELIREHLSRRVAQQRSPERLPPPAPEEIRRQMGWHMLPSNRRPDRVDRD